MSGIAGFSVYTESLTEEKYLWMALARRMARRISHRGPDDRGAHVSEHCALAHVRLALQDPENGLQPMTVHQGGCAFTIAYDGELWNAAELRRELEAQCFHFHTSSDTEVVLKAYLCYGEACAPRLCGSYAFVVDDSLRRLTFLCRDRFGGRPLFYSLQNDRLAFASELKGLFEYPGLAPEVGREGLCEVLGLDSVRTPGCAVFEHIQEVKPGHTVLFDADGLRDREYFHLEARPHLEEYEETARTLQDLLTEAVACRLDDGGPLCAFLEESPGSELAAAIAAKELGRRGRQLCAYSFELEGFGAPLPPAPAWENSEESRMEELSRALSADHTTLVCAADTLGDCLFEEVIARDLPGIPGKESLLFPFGRLIQKRHRAALCSAGAEELFCSSSWFQSGFDPSRFPWPGMSSLWASLLKPELLQLLRMEEYAAVRLQEALDSCPVLRGEPAHSRQMRELSYLTLTRYLPSLLEREDRCSMANGLELRSPYTDHRLIQYVFNLPWEWKCGPQKNLFTELRKAFLPKDAPKPEGGPQSGPSGPEYGPLLKQRLTYILQDSLQPIQKLLSPEAVKQFLAGPLPSDPLTASALIQVNYWLLHYGIYLKL